MMRPKVAAASSSSLWMNESSSKSPIGRTNNNNNNSFFPTTTTTTTNTTTSSSLDNTTNSNKLLTPFEMEDTMELESSVNDTIEGNNITTTNNNNNTSSSADPHASGLGGDIPSAITGIIKGMVGPAILYLPHGFAQAGYAVAMIILFVATILYLHSSQCLLQAWKYETTHQEAIQLEKKEGHLITTKAMTSEHEKLVSSNSTNATITTLSTTTTATKATTKATSTTTTTTNIHLSYSDLAKRAFGVRGETLVQVGIAAMQSGVCLTYLIFVPHNLQSSLRILLQNDNDNDDNAAATTVNNNNVSSTNFYLLLMLLIEIPLSWIQDIRKLTVTNTLANTLILYGLSLCLYFAIQQQQEEGELFWNTLHNNNNIHNNNSHRRLLVLEQEDDSDHTTTIPMVGTHWILFIGTAVLLFEGSITLLLPLQEAVQATTTPTARRKMKGWGLLSNKDEDDTVTIATDTTSSSTSTNRMKRMMMMDPEDEEDAIMKMGVGDHIPLAKTTTTPSAAVTTTTTMNNNNNPRERFPLVYRKVIIGIMVFYVIFGTTCAIAFGPSVHTVLTTSLPPTYLATTVQLAYSVAVLFTFPLQQYPALEIVCRSITQYFMQQQQQQQQSSISSSSHHHYNHWWYNNVLVRYIMMIIPNNTNKRIRQFCFARNTIASLWVCGLGIIAVSTMDSLDKVVSLMGSLVGCPVAFIIPPLIHSKLVPPSSKWRTYANISVAILGSIAMVFASLTTIWQWND